MKRRILHFESLGGASGDMLLAALFGLGVSSEETEMALRSLDLDPFRIVAEPARESGMTGLRVRVETEAGAEEAHGRHYSTIRRLIEAGDLPENVRRSAIDVFRRIGEAESEIHGVPLEAIHFHEVGAMDSIVDVVGCCWALNELAPDEITIRSLPQGIGTLTCAHGTYPNPAPATLRLLEGFPIEPTDEPFELVTPTGAALLSAWRTGSAPPVGARPVRTAYAFGHRRLSGRPNLLRATLLEEDGEPGAGTDEILALECNLDDQSPELTGLLCEGLMEAGALDVFAVPVFMKKWRTGAWLTVLCLPSDRDRMLERIFRESTTLGVRERFVRRTVLDRRIESVETPYGPVGIKRGFYAGKSTPPAPEIEDCRRLALAAGVPVESVFRAALAAASS